MCSSWPGRTARMCVLEGQGEGASRARACLHDVVSSSSARFVIFLLPSLSCPSPPTRGRGRTSEVLSPFWRHHASFALPPTSVRPSVREPGRPFEARPVDRDGSGGGARGGRRRWPRPPSAFMLCGFVVIISSSQLCTAAGAARLRKGHRPGRVQTCVERLS